MAGRGRPGGSRLGGGLERLLALPPERVAALLVEDTEAMRDLRQTTPFAGALPHRDRWRIVREIR